MSSFEQNFALATCREIGISILRSELRPLGWWFLGPLFTEALSYYNYDFPSCNMQVNRDFYLAVSPQDKKVAEDLGFTTQSWAIKSARYLLPIHLHTFETTRDLTSRNGEADDQTDFFPSPPFSLQPKSQLLFFSSSSQPTTRWCWCYWQHHKWLWCCSGPQLPCGHLSFLL